VWCLTFRGTGRIALGAGPYPRHGRPPKRAAPSASFSTPFPHLARHLADAPSICNDAWETTQLARRLEADLLAAGERIVRVPPKLTANFRTTARTYGKSDPIDALAVARSALREPGLPTAQLDGPSRELRLLVDYREDLVAERTRIINRLRWHLHELDSGLDPVLLTCTST